VASARAGYGGGGPGSAAVYDVPFYCSFLGKAEIPVERSKSRAAVTVNTNAGGEKLTGQLGE
jgi:hypothetical protein